MFVSWILIQVQLQIFLKKPRTFFCVVEMSPKVASKQLRTSQLYTGTSAKDLYRYDTGVGGVNRYHR